MKQKKEDTARSKPTQVQVPDFSQGFQNHTLDERGLLSSQGAGNLHVYLENNEIRSPSRTLYSKSHLKWRKDLNMIPEVRLVGCFIGKEP